MNTINTTPGTWYCIFCTAPATVTAEIEGEYVTLVVLDSEGKEAFCAPTDCITIDTDGKFRVLPTRASAGNSAGGGYVNSNLVIGHGAADAVAAVCTLAPGDLTKGGSLNDGTTTLTLENPHTYATGSAAFRDAAEACTLTIGEWSKTWDEKKEAKASGVFSIMGDEGTISVTNGEDEYSVQVPANYDTSVDDWNAAFAEAGCGIVCTAVDPHGETEVSVEAAEVGEAGNGFVISVVNYEPVTLDGGSTARTAWDVYNDILADADCPVDVTLDADEQGLGFTAKEYGVNDTISAVGDMFANWSGMSGGHGDYTVAELATAINGEFDDITATADETAGTIVLTANTAGASANATTYTATGCFGGGTTRQGSTVCGRNAVAQTDYEIILNGNRPRLLKGGEDATVMKNGGVYTVAAAGGSLDFGALTVEDYATAEIWIDYSAGSVTLPETWSWVDGIVPSFTAGARHFLRVKSDGAAVMVELKYSYTHA